MHLIFCKYGNSLNKFKQNNGIYSSLTKHSLQNKDLPQFPFVFSRIKLGYTKAQPRRSPMHVAYLTIVLLLIWNELSEESVVRAVNAPGHLHFRQRNELHYISCVKYLHTLATRGLSYCCNYYFTSLATRGLSYCCNYYFASLATRGLSYYCYYCFTSLATRGLSYYYSNKSPLLCNRHGGVIGTAV